MSYILILFLHGTSPISSRKKIEIDFDTISTCSYKLNARKQTTNTSTMATEIAQALDAGKWYTGDVEPSSFKSFWTWTTNTKYADGSNYTGNLDRFGKRTGRGTFRSPIYLYGSYDIENKASAATIVNWMEYYGEWRNDKPNGWGIVKSYRGNGLSTTKYEGIWANGEPVNDP